MYQRTLLRSPSSSSSLPTSRGSSPSLMSSSSSSVQPTICGLPLKYVSLLTLALQNAALSIVMHYSRVSIHPDMAYSPATAVLLNELFKGSISFLIAFALSPHKSISARFSSLLCNIFSPDSWKLSIPAILYVVQNSLQFVAISNLPVATFQVTYQMKILTTAAFSVVMLRKKLTGIKWIALFFLAVGVAVVQLQTSASASKPPSPPVVGSAQEYIHLHHMSPLKGFMAVTAACFTSGLAGVYFEMVLKGSKSDLWVRNVQLSLFSLIPALLPVLYGPRKYPAHSSSSPYSFFSSLFHNFGVWAWATVFIQVLGGLLTAVVIKYSDNILKGFATSLSIVLSFLASVVLFEFRITGGFLIGASIVLGATWMYNRPELSSGPSSPVQPPPPAYPEKEKLPIFSLAINEKDPYLSPTSSPALRSSYPGTPTAHLHPHSSSSSRNASASVLSSLGVTSFMRRKQQQQSMSSSSSIMTPSNPPSRNSSSASLFNLVSLSRTGDKDKDKPLPSLELGAAENGEVVHLHPYAPQTPESPYSGQMASFGDVGVSSMSRAGSPIGFAKGN